MITYPFVLPELLPVFVFIFILPYKIDRFKLRPPLSNIIIIITIILTYVYFKVAAEGSAFRLFFSGDYYNGNNLSVKNIAGTFFSFDASHLVGNLIYLYIFGNLIAAEFSYKFYFLVLLFSTVLVAGLDTALDVYSIGISGFVYSLAGACLVLFPRREVKFFYSLIILNGTFKLRLFWFVLPMVLIDIFAIVNNILGKFHIILGQNYTLINHNAHLLGFIAGIIIAHVSIRDKAIKAKSTETRLADLVENKNDITVATTFNQDNRHIIFAVLLIIFVQAVISVWYFGFIVFDVREYSNMGMFAIFMLFWNMLMEPFVILLVLILGYYKKLSTLVVFGILIALRIGFNLLTHRVIEYGLDHILVVLFLLQATRSTAAWPYLPRYFSSLKARLKPETG